MKTIYLIPPSETKKQGGELLAMSRSFPFPLPKKIAQSATPKDLKCTGKRYEEALQLNHVIDKSHVMGAIFRYTGIMYNAIDFASLSSTAQDYFNNHVIIVSGMFGLLKPQDLIANYKLPIDTIGLKQYRTKYLNKQLLRYCKDNNITQIINLLPVAHSKIVDRKMLENMGIAYHEQEFVQDGKKLGHFVKKTKGLWLREQIEKM